MYTFMFNTRCSNKKYRAVMGAGRPAQVRPVDAQPLDSLTRSRSMASFHCLFHSCISILKDHIKRNHGGRPLSHHVACSLPHAGGKASRPRCSPSTLAFVSRKQKKTFDSPTLVPANLKDGCSKTEHWLQQIPKMMEEKKGCWFQQKSNWFQQKNKIVAKIMTVTAPTSS